MLYEIPERIFEGIPVIPEGMPARKLERFSEAIPAEFRKTYPERNFSLAGISERITEEIPGEVT